MSEFSLPLAHLIKDNPFIQHKGCGNIKVTGITANSQDCQKGFLFVATKGARSSSRDGHHFIQHAISNGASAIVAQDPWFKEAQSHVPIIWAKDSKAALCHLAESFYDDPSSSLCVIGITGTNGKTSTSFMLHSILREAGHSPKIMGTLGMGDPLSLSPLSHTTMEPEFISRALHRMKSQGATHVIMEVSSHALALKRVEAIRFKAVALTNITQDHLDFHVDMEEYQRAKARLFFEIKGDETPAVLPQDHPWTDEIDRLTKVSFYGRALNIHHQKLPDGHHGTVFTLSCGDRSHSLALPFSGDFHVKNACLAFELARSLGIDGRHIIEGLKKCPQIPGRLESIKTHHPFRVFVDYAHTPHALLSLLKAVSRMGGHRIILLFGCGGDRDVGKRPLMGEIASAHADEIIISDDNPRTEDPNSIRQQILSGMVDRSKALEIPDRREAIRYAIERAKANDIVVIAGKGHESYQIYGDNRYHFSDQEESRHALDQI